MDYPAQKNQVSSILLEAFFAFLPCTLLFVYFLFICLGSLPMLQAAARSLDSALPDSNSVIWVPFRYFDC